MKKLILAAIAAFVLCAGCASLLDENSSARLTTMYATLKVIDGDPDKANRVEAIATEVQRYASGEEFLTVNLLIAAIRSEINWGGLDAADTLLVDALLGQLRIELIDRFGEDVLPEDLRLAADTVASWVIAAAQMT